MDTQLIQRKFEALGARALVQLSPETDGIAVDIQSGGEERFLIKVAPRRVSDLQVVDLQPQDRHLLLMSRLWDARKQKFLCGHDERHWFVAAIPEDAHAANVRQAKEALKPWPVRHLQNRLQVPYGQRRQRRTAAYVRQGEWFFVPTEARIPDLLVRRNEPLVRSGGTPHIAEFCHRSGGQIVYVRKGDTRAISPERWRHLVHDKPTLAKEYQQQRMGMAVLVRGRIRHRDHATLHLARWHEVFMNTEHQAEARRYVMFID